MAFCIFVLANKSVDETVEEAFTRVGKNMYTTTMNIVKGSIDNG